MAGGRAAPVVPLLGQPQQLPRRLVRRRQLAALEVDDEAAVERLLRGTVLEWIYRYARQARLVDGASEVHEMVIARACAEQGLEFWR